MATIPRPPAASAQPFHQGRAALGTVVAAVDPVVSAMGVGATVAAEMAAAERPESVSRLNRFRSDRKSAALW